jgi:8-oxo-dGTP diphosphatase
MDVVRAFHRALNDADVDALVALYHPDCIVEHVWTGSGDVVDGRDGVRERWRDDFARFVRPPSERRYPTRPLVGVGAVVLSPDGRVLIVKRRQEPLAGQWSLPGGMLEIGETLEAGVAREIHEEAGLVVTVGPVVEAFDRILLDDTGQVRYHFVLVDYLCHVRGGDLCAGSDVEAAQFADPADLPRHRLTGKTEDVIAKALRIQSVNHG